MVIVNWTLCITFGIFKLFGQWAGYFVTLVRVWKAPWRTIWNECRIVLKICHSLRTMLKICSMTNWNPISAISYAHLPIYLHQLWEVCRVLLLRSNSFDDWPSSIAKRCSSQLRTMSYDMSPWVHILATSKIWHLATCHFIGQAIYLSILSIHIFCPNWEFYLVSFRFSFPHCTLFKQCIFPSY